MQSDVSTAGADQVRGGRTVKELERELAEARDQQAATAEILAAISSSPMNLQRVFAEVAASAARLCDANDAAMHQVDGDVLRSVAHHGPISFPETLPLTRGVLTARAVLDRQTIQVADMQAEADEFPSGSDRTRSLGFRTILSVPLIRAGEAIGVISLRRAEVRPFTDRQIELLKTFADQAVIAIENTRLFEEVQARTRELAKALEQQTATSEVLSVISSSPGELKPVFEAMLENAVRICGAKFGNLWLREGGGFRIAATHGAPPAYLEYFQLEPVVEPDPRSGLGVIRRPRSRYISKTSRPRPRSKTRCARPPSSWQRRAAWSACRCSMTARSWAASPSTARKFGRLATNRSICSPISRSKPSLPSRTRACSMSCANPPTANGYGRRAQGHQPLADGYSACVRRNRRKCHSSVQC